MEGDCEECMTWKQSIYWTHFQSLQFCQILEGDFRSQLMIPKKFSDNVRGKLQETVTLKGPCGTVTWEVGITVSDNMLFFRDGWEEFVNAFTLEENDILIFKYNGNSCLNVMIFDRRSLCEKVSSYFIKKCGHPTASSGNQEKRFLKDSSEEVIQEYAHENYASTPPKKPKKDVDGEKLVGSSQLILNDMSQSKGPCDDVGATQERPRNQKPLFTWEPVKLPRAGKNNPRKSTSPNTYSVTYISRRKTVTEVQKQAALQMARKELRDNSFLVVMRATHVYKRFYVTVPSEWIASMHLTYKKQLVRLRTTEKTWPTRLLFDCKGRGGLSSGWKEFSLDNCLEEFDVCLFKLASQKHEPVVLDVSIFRVVSEVVKPIVVS